MTLKANTSLTNRCSQTGQTAPPFCSNLGSPSQIYVGLSQLPMCCLYDTFSHLRFKELWANYKAKLK